LKCQEELWCPTFIFENFMIILALVNNITGLTKVGHVTNLLTNLCKKVGHEKGAL